MRKAILDRCDRGFTVVELLVAISIVAGITAFLGAAINLGRQYISRSTEVLATAEDVSLLRRVMSEQLRNVIFDGRIPAIAGTARELTIRVPETRAPALPGPVTFTVTAGNNGAETKASWRSDSPLERPIVHSLIERSRDVLFSYFTESTGWVNAWSNADQIPSLIRISFRNFEGNAIDLVFAVQSVQSVECATQPAKQFCQALK
jgi:prepilin-type N-terminal cleavage/methylation domain-containing protein